MCTWGPIMGRDVIERPVVETLLNAMGVSWWPNIIYMQFDTTYCKMCKQYILKITTLAMFNENLRWFEKCHATAPPRTSILHNVTKKQFIVSAASKEGGKLKGPAGDEKKERGSFPHNFHTTPCFLHFHSSTAQRPEVCSEYTCTQGTTVGLGGKSKDS